MGSAGDQRPAGHAHRPFARCVSEAAAANHHADRLRAASSGASRDEPRGARVPGQADLAQGAARPSAVDLGAAAADGADGQVLHPQAAQAGAAGRTARSGLTLDRYRRDSRHKRNSPDPTTTAEPTMRLTVGTSPHTKNPSTAAQTSDR